MAFNEKGTKGRRKCIMKNKNNKSRNPVFIPYGLEIPKSEIFDSVRNLGVAIVGALTGTPPEDVKINAANISIGLGCFSLIGVAISDEYEGPESIDLCDFDDCHIYSSVRYSVNLDTKNIFLSKKYEEPVVLTFHIYPESLLNGEVSGVNIFGPKRILSYLKSDEMNLIVEGRVSMVDLDNYLEGGLEPVDGMLTPSADELELIMHENDPEKRFGMLMNMITTFASMISAKMIHSGFVRPAALLSYSEEARTELIDNCAKKRIGKPWKPSKKLVEDGMKYFNLKKRDLDPSVRKLFWPKKKG